MDTRPNYAARPIIGHLATFIAVAETRSFRRAAELVGRSQPAVTAQIRQLEGLLGVALFTRSTRQVVPTVAGVGLLDRAKKLVAETERLVRDFQSQAQLMSGRIDVSVSPTVATGMIARSLVLFEREYPRIDVSIREDMAADMVEALQTGDVELGIGPYRDVPERLTFRPLFEQPFYLILPADHAIARQGKAAFRDLAGLPLLCPARGTTARGLIESAAAEAGIAVHAKYEAMQYQTLLAMVSAGLGVTVMPLIDRRILTALGLVAPDFEDVRLSREVGAISRLSEQLSGPAMAFLNLLGLMSSHDQGADLTGFWPLSAPPDAASAH